MPLPPLACCLQVKQFYTAPTAIRSLMRSGDDWVRKHNRNSLRVLGTVGEPINPEAWRWYHEIVGNGEPAGCIAAWPGWDATGALYRLEGGATSVKSQASLLPLKNSGSIAFGQHENLLPAWLPVAGACPIVDTWWQTETGGHMIVNLPAAWHEKPGSATLPFFGVKPVVVDEKGNELEGEGSSPHFPSKCHQATSPSF